MNFLVLSNHYLCSQFVYCDCCWIHLLPSFFDSHGHLPLLPRHAATLSRCTLPATCSISLPLGSASSLWSSEVHNFSVGLKINFLTDFWTFDTWNFGYFYKWSSYGPFFGYFFYWNQTFLVVCGNVSTCYENLSHLFIKELYTWYASSGRLLTEDVKHLILVFRPGSRGK